MSEFQCSAVTLGKHKSFICDAFQQTHIQCIAVSDKMLVFSEYRQVRIKSKCNSVACYIYKQSTAQKYL